MPQSNSMIYEADIDEMVRVIVETANPELVILFGSRATGKAKPDSDVDFLIVEDEDFGSHRSRMAEYSRIRKALRDFFIPMDLLVFSRTEFERWRGALNHVIARATREGKVVYERH